MKRHPSTPLRRGLVAALLACGAPAGVLAEPVPARVPVVDPLRPPSVTAPRALDTPARAGSTAAPRTWPTLQSVHLPARGGASAIVDGRLVRVGERIGEATLTAIDAHSIVLRTPRYTQHIGLTPGIAKTASVASPIIAAQPAVALAPKEQP